MTISVIISLVILTTYVIWTSVKYGVPDSISQSYYNLKWSPLFTLVIWTCGFLILPTIMDQTAAVSSTQVVPFLGVFGLLLVGAAPRVRDYERTIHIIGASIAGIFSQLWIILYGNPWTLLLWIGPMILLMSLMIRRDKDLDKVNFVFWVEITAFAQLYLSLLIN